MDELQKYRQRRKKRLMGRYRNAVSTREKVVLLLAILEADGVKIKTNKSHKPLDFLPKVYYNIYGVVPRQDDEEPATWITTENGHKVPLDKNGTAIAGGGGTLAGKDFSEASSSEKPQGEAKEESQESGQSSTVPSKVSARGKNDPPKGFATEERKEYHYDKHVIKDNAVLYRGMTIEEYDEHAKEFLSKPCGGSIDGYATEDGVVCRFDSATGEYAKGVPGGIMKTCMVAKCNKKTGEPNLEAAQRYFDFWKAEEGINDEQEA